MIQDRLTAKFQSAKPVAKRETKPQHAAVEKTKASKPAATSSYTRGRQIAATFWL